MGATIGIAGLALTGLGKVYAGEKQKAADDYGASVLSQEAGQSTASGIQASIMERRKGAYIASNARARIAAGGLATTSPSELKVVGDIRGQSEYDALTSLYQGEDRALEIGTRAQTLRNEGSASETAGWMAGISTALSGGTSFYDKYGASTAPATT